MTEEQFPIALNTLFKLVSQRSFSDFWKDIKAMFWSYKNRTIVIHWKIFS